MWLGSEVRSAYEVRSSERVGGSEGRVGRSEGRSVLEVRSGEGVHRSGLGNVEMSDVRLSEGCEEILYKHTNIQIYWLIWRGWERRKD